MKALVVALLGLAGLVPAPARVNPEVVYVNSLMQGATHAGYLRAAMTYVDQFTRTQMVLGSCVDNSRCITLTPGRISNCERPNKVNGCAETGWTTCTDTEDTRQRCTTVMDTRPVANSYGPVYWVRLYEHELAHSYGIHGHSSQTTNIMYAPIGYYVNGSFRVVPEYFKPDQQETLALW